MGVSQIHMLLILQLKGDAESCFRINLIFMRIREQFIRERIFSPQLKVLGI